MAELQETRSGVPGMAEIAWGAHHCHFYEGREDLADTLVPYFKAGLDQHESCLWVTSAPFGATEARQALAAHVPDLPDRERRGQIEIIDHRDWYLRTGQTDARGTVDGWLTRERAALEAGYQGLRLTGNTYWVEREDWDSFVAYERMVNEAFRDRRIVGLCSYCLGRCSSRDVLDVVANHGRAVVRRDGRWQLLESEALRLARNDLLRVQEAAELLRSADRRKDEFMAMLGHELRNPLAPITTAMQLMRLRGAGDRFGKEIDIIERQSRHLKRLVEDLLDVSRITSGKLNLRRRRLELGEAVAWAVELAAPVVEAKQHTLRVDVPADGLAVDADQERLTQALSNVLTNAAKYTPPGGHIHVHGQAREGVAVLRIRDDGPGIAPELLPRVFELFVQGRQAAARPEGGLGLGLPIVKSLIELHGGRVSLDSTPGAGTTVTITLPRLCAGAPESLEGVADRAAGRRILLVDDNVDLGEMIAEGLRMAGHEVVLCTDPMDALTRAAAVRPELALLDVGLPGMDGYELGERLRALPGLGGLGLIALTGYGTDRDRARAAEAGFDQHLVKPVDFRVLLDAVARTPARTN